MLLSQYIPPLLLFTILSLNTPIFATNIGTDAGSKSLNHPVSLYYTYRDEFDVSQSVSFFDNPTVPSSYGYVSMFCKCARFLEPNTKVHLRQVDNSDILLSSKCDKTYANGPNSDIWHTLQMHKAIGMKYYCHVQDDGDVRNQSRTGDFMPGLGSVCAFSDLLNHSYGILIDRPTIALEWDSENKEFAPKPTYSMEYDGFCMAIALNDTGDRICNSQVDDLIQLSSLKIHSKWSQQVDAIPNQSCEPDYCSFYDKLYNRELGPSFYSVFCDTICLQPSLQLNDGTKVYPGNSYLLEHMKLVGPDELVPRYPFGDIMLNIRCKGEYQIALQNGRIRILERGLCGGINVMKTIRLDYFEIRKSFRIDGVANSNINESIIDKNHTSRIRIEVAIFCSPEFDFVVIPFYIYSILEDNQNSNIATESHKNPTNPVTLKLLADENCDVKCTLILRNTEPLFLNSTFLLANYSLEIPPIRGLITGLEIKEQVITNHVSNFDLRCEARWSVDYFLYNPVGRRRFQIENQKAEYLFIQKESDMIKEDCLKANSTK